MPRSKVELESTLKKIESELKLLQQDFLNIKKKSKSTIKNAVSRRDTKKIDDIRKKLGLSS